jgi:dTDP-4-amino-4,6-dideoxygalactose transaminase
MPTPVPFHRPTTVASAAEQVLATMAGPKPGGDGPVGKEVERRLEEITGARRVLLTTSCTHALELAATLVGVEPGDEVIVPSFTFVSTALAFVMRGATPVFCDIRRDTLNLDERLLPDLVTDRTKAIVPVHYGGIACEMDEIVAVARPRGIAVVEDAAHALLGSYRGRPVGSLGDMAAFSFHETKNFQCGEGGALAVTEAADAGRGEILREKGTDRSKFLRGLVHKYTWVDVGSSYLPSDLLSAFLLAQLCEAEVVQGARATIWHRYRDELVGWAAEQGVQLPVLPDHVVPAAHLFHMVLPTPEDQAALRAHLAADGIASTFHYQPLHSSPMGRQVGKPGADCPVTDHVATRLLRLPFFTSLGADDQSRVIESVLGFSCA